MRLRLFFMFMIIFLLPMLLLSIGGEVWMSENITRNAENSYSSIMENVAHRLDNDIKSLSDVATLVSADTTIRKLANMSGSEIDFSRVSMSTLQDYKTELAFHCQNSRLYSIAAACFPTKNFVLSTLGIWKLEWFLNAEFKIQTLGYPETIDLLNSGGMLYNCAVSRFDARENGLVCILPAYHSASGKTLMSMLFFIEDDILNSYLDDLTLFPGTVAILCDADGQQISTHSVGTSIPYETFSSCPEDSDTCTIEGDRYRVMHYTSPELEWQYTVYVPENTLYSETNAFRSTIHIVMAVLFLIGLILSLELSRINYRPFEHFFHLLSLHHTPFLRSSTAQLREAEEALLSIINEKNTLDERLRTNRPMVRYAALIHLLEGTSDASSLMEKETLALMDLSMPYGAFASAILLHTPIAEPVVWITTEGCVCFLLEYHGKITALINFSTPEALHSLLESLTEEADCICLSQSVGSLVDLPHAYEQASSVRRQLPIRPNEKIIVYSNDHTAKSTFRYTADAEKRVLAAIRSGNAEQANSEAMQLLEYGDSDRLSPDAVRKLVIAIETSVAKLDVQGKLAERLGSLSIPEDSTEGYLSHMHSVLHTAAEYCRSREERQQTERTEQIVAFIEDHLCDEQLSLSMVAEAFDMTTTYLSRYFKEHLETNYLDFVNRRRIVLAKQLLAQGAGSVREIAGQVGFSSDATFRRQYKKYEGVSPSIDIHVLPDSSSEDDFPTKV